MECWNVGMLECWNVGMLECWKDGMIQLVPILIDVVGYR
jgi:hypothetical protein